MTDSAANPTGTLVLVSTPIGNLGDMTFRGVEALRGASMILAEDTRQTRKLLVHYSIDNRVAAYHDHNKERVTPGIVERLRDGDTVALVSDAGTPGISDPGFYLVRAAIAAGMTVTAVPGANAILPALLLSGFPTDAFLFDGFPPRKSGQLTRLLQSYEKESRTVVLFVSPHRLVKVLETAAEVLPERELAVVREITKIHEEVRRGRAAELAAYYTERKVRGEIVLLVRGAGK